jgi:hypothetical protein
MGRDIQLCPRRWTKERIETFTKLQRHARKWICFEEIADWCSKEDGSIVPSAEKRTTAFEVLKADLLEGEFDEGGRTRVLYLYPDTQITRMTSERLREIIEWNYDGRFGRKDYLPHCWIPRRLFNRWLAKHRLHESPARFQPIKSTQVVRSRSTSGQENFAIKALAAHLRQNPVLTRADASSWCKNKGYRLILLIMSQKVAAFADENHVFGKIQFSACRGLRWVCQNLVTLHCGFRRTSRV